MTALVAGFVFAILGYLLGRQWLDNRRRSRALREASDRPPSDWHESCRKIASLNRCPPEEIERIWKALSDHYGIEADKVSPDDTLGGFLKDVFEHPDYELMFVLPALAHVLDHDKPSPRTWGELVAWMWWHERRARAKADGAQIGA